MSKKRILTEDKPLSDVEVIDILLQTPVSLEKTGPILSEYKKRVSIPKKETFFFDRERKIWTFK